MAKAKLLDTQKKYVTLQPNYVHLNNYKIC